jgi:hypothetical protein
MTPVLTDHGTSTLRAAIMEANAYLGANTLIIPEGNYVLSLVSTDEDAVLDGDLDSSEYVTINGAGAMDTVIDGNGERIFRAKQFPL